MSSSQTTSYSGSGGLCGKVLPKSLTSFSSGISDSGENNANPVPYSASILFNLSQYPLKSKLNCFGNERRDVPGFPVGHAVKYFQVVFSSGGGRIFDTSREPLPTGARRPGVCRGGGPALLPRTAALPGPDGPICDGCLYFNRRRERVLKFPGVLADLTCHDPHRSPHPRRTSARHEAGVCSDQRLP
jgi:hypothetical protein